MLQVAGALLCIALVLLFVDFAAIVSVVATLDYEAFLLAVAAHMIIIFLLAWRWRSLINAVTSPMPFASALRMTFVGTFLNLTLPTSVAGDVGRVWMARGTGPDLAGVSAASIMDRMVGVAVLCAIVSVGALYVRAYAVSILLLGLVVGAVYAAKFLLLRDAPAKAFPRVLQTAWAALQRLGGQRQALAAAQVISLLAHVLAALIAALLAHGMGLPLSVWQALALFPAIILAAVLPLTVGGWGLRELVAIPVLAIAGLDAESATSVAVVFGVTQLIASGVGIVGSSVVRPRAAA